VTLDWGSKVQISVDGQTPVVELQSGAAQYSLKSFSSVKLVGHNQQPIALTKLNGRVVYVNAEAAARVVGMGAHPFPLVLAAGGAVGLGYGIYEGVSGGSSVSPSH
jgi:hypothetical protein